jgi:pyrimidine-nucleoside phosphorylase
VACGESVFVIVHVPTLIERKRDGGTLTTVEIEWLIAAFTSGDLPDYQMSALAMAICCRGMNSDEITALTRAMMHSGRVLDYPAGSPPKIDKHSTGGIGDKVSIVLAPLLACGNVWVPMISGRGLGITGGTLDKLESIPGFRTAMDESDALRQLERIGVFMIGQTADICPADRKLYALRDVTGTVPSQALIIASIMSKKLAENLDRLVLDVKWGSGAFMKTAFEAEQLAAGLTNVGSSMGVQVAHVITPMNEPLGRSSGNALEVSEAVAALQGNGPEDLVELTLDLAERVGDQPRETYANWLRDGTAWNKFIQLVEAQGGDAATLERNPHVAPIVRVIEATQSGTVAKMDAGLIGHACLLLGAGRRRTTDTVDFAVGCDRIAKTGEAVSAGDILLRVHARDETSLAEALPLLERAVEIDSQ